MSISVNKLLSNLFIDIETVPQNKNFFNMNEKWRDLFIEKNAKIIAEDENYDQHYNERAGILAEFGKIICISIGYLYAKEDQLCIKVMNIAGDNEKELLEKFINYVDRFATKYSAFNFAGHNIKEFDIPYICRRIYANHLPFPAFLPDHAAKPWETRTIDTLHWWRFGDYKSYISLDLLAHVMEVPTSKTDIKGSDVRNVYYEENDLERIAAYCGRDVVVVANLILRFSGLPLLKEENIVWSK